MKKIILLLLLTACGNDPTPVTSYDVKGQTPAPVVKIDTLCSPATKWTYHVFQAYTAQDVAYMINEQDSVICIGGMAVVENSSSERRTFLQAALVK